VRGVLRGDDGVATPVEMLGLLVFCLLSVAFLGYLGRLHATGLLVTTAAQSAARAASIEATPTAAQAAATAAVAQSLGGRCTSAPVVRMSWSAGPAGAWRGGSVTVEVSCTVPNRSLTTLWTPGARTLVMRDTQPVDRYRR
jgi:Flp pilus assembly protein TadG